MLMDENEKKNSIKKTKKTQANLANPQNL